MTNLFDQLFKAQVLTVSGKRGFTLIEAMVAIFIIVVGIMAILQMFPLSIQQQKMGERSTVATELGQAKIEEVTAKSYDDILAGLTTEDYGTILGFNVYKRVTHIACVNASLQEAACSYDSVGDPQPVKKVEVTVYWKLAFGAVEKELKIATLIAKR